MPKLASTNTDVKKSGGIKESDRISESPPSRRVIHFSESISQTDLQL